MSQQDTTAAQMRPGAPVTMRRAAPASMTLSTPVRAAAAAADRGARAVRRDRQPDRSADAAAVGRGPRVADIALYINSPGGSVTAGMAIFDTMEFIECDVATYAMGLAASMGQFLLSAGTPASGTRCRTARSSCTSCRPGSVARSRTSRSRRSCSAGTSVRWRADLPAHRQTVERITADFDRDPVLRAGGEGLRLRGPRDLAGRAAARRDPERERSAR